MRTGCGKSPLSRWVWPAVTTCSTRWRSSSTSSAASNAPASAFVDGRMIRGIQEHLFAVLRDILYIHGEVYEHGSIALADSEGITNAVYRILRNAGLLRPRVRPASCICSVVTACRRNDWR